MVKHVIPPALRGLINEDYKNKTPYKKDGKLHRLFQKLFAEWYGITDFVKTTDPYDRLAELISDAKGRDNYVRGSTLRDIYFCNREEKLKETLITVFNFLEKDLERQGKRGAIFWLPKLEPISANTTAYPGAMVINSGFIEKVITSNEPLTNSDRFYLGDQQNFCQWFGVISGWDARREQYHAISSAVVRSFDSYCSHIVVAAVLGDGGSGKSTLLRRMAIDFINENFTTFWITGIEDFIENFAFISSDTSSKYLLIIEEWETLKSANAVTNNKFFNESGRLNNVRIVIGDRLLTDKQYLEFALREALFVLGPEENKNIVEKCVLMRDEWKDIATSVLQQMDVQQCSLYSLLFVIARSYKTQVIPETADRDVTLYFKGIVRRDMQTLYLEDKGLARALYSAAYLCGTKKRHFTWRSLLKMAEYFNSLDPNASDIECNPSDNAQIILNRYFWQLRPDNLYLSDTVICVFHHDLLAEEGFSEPLFSEWRLKKSTLFELVRALCKMNEKPYAADLFLILTYGLTTMSIGDKMSNYYDLHLHYIKPLSEELIRASKLSRVYSFVATRKNESDWEVILSWLVQEYWFSYGNNSTVRIQEILNRLIVSGCKAKCIVEAHKSSKGIFGKRNMDALAEKLLDPRKAGETYEAIEAVFGQMYRSTTVAYTPEEFERLTKGSEYV